MERKIDAQLKELYDKGIPIYSISRLDSINQCLYQAYNTYVLHNKGVQNVYGMLGGKTHDVLEGITNGTHTEADLKPAILEELNDLELVGLEFPKDRSGKDSIKEGWITDMMHFASTYRAPKGNLKAEEFFLYQTPKGNYLQGYIDLQKIRADGSIDIYDYKTSSLYTGEAIKEHQRQLILYALGLEQLGYKVNSSSWIFLKYVEVTFDGYKSSVSKKKTPITKIVERKKLYSDLFPFMERDLLKMGYEEFEIEIVLDKFKETLLFEDLPDCLKGNYHMKPYVKKAELTEETKSECIKYIEDTIERWEGLGEDEKNYPPKEFVRVQKNGKTVDDTFFCQQLCNHKKSCRYLHEFIELKYANMDDDNLF